jgi:ABC-2 type transport system permease protein
MRALGLSFPRLAEDTYMILVITGALLSSLTLRYDKDSRLAMSIYSLPIRNYKVVLAKFIASFVLLFLSVIIPFFLTLVYTYGDAPDLLKGALFGEGFFISYFIFWLLACLYVISLSSLIAELSPNLFASLLGGVTLLYLPKILDIAYLPPAVLNSAFLTSQTAFDGVTQKILMLVDKAFVSCILIPLTLLGMTLLISEWRDVV